MRALHLEISQNESGPQSRSQNYSLFSINYISCSTAIFTHARSTHVSFCYWLKQTIVMKDKAKRSTRDVCLIYSVVVDEISFNSNIFSLFYSELLSNCFYTYANS